MSNEKNPLPEPKEVDINPHVGSITQKEKAMLEEYSYVVDAVASVLYSKKEVAPNVGL